MVDYFDCDELVGRCAALRLVVKVETTERLPARIADDGHDRRTKCAT